MTTEIGTLVIDLKAQVARLESDMKKSANVVKKSSDEIDKAAGFAKKSLLALAAAFGLNQIKALVDHSFQAIDVMAKMADRLGIVSEKMGGLNHVADLAGVSQQTLATGMRAMLKTVAEAAQGMGDGARAFDTLNLSARELSRLSPDQQLLKIITALEGVENVTLRSATAAQIFGGRATEMLNLISEGAEGIRKATADAEAWGLAVNRVDAAKIEQANDAVTRAKGAFEGVLNTIAIHLAPVITALADGFADSAAKANGFRDQVASGMETVSITIAYTANVLRGLHVVWDGLKLTAAEVINVIVQSLYDLDHAFVDVVNKVSGSWVGKKLNAPILEYSKVIDDVATVSAFQIREMRDEFQALVMQDMPADKILEWFAKVKAESQKTAERMARDRAAMNDRDGGEGIDNLDKILDEQERRKTAEFGKFMEGEFDKMAAMEASFLSQMEQEELNYQIRSERAQLWRDAQLIDDTRLAELQTKLAADHAKKREQIESQTGNTIRSMHQGVWQSVAGVMQQFAGKSRAAAIAVIAINKGLAVAQTIQSTAAAIMRAYADLGPIAGSAAAAQIGVLGKIQVGLIVASGLGEAANLDSGSGSIGGGSSGGSFPGLSTPGSTFEQPSNDSGRSSVMLNLNIYGHVVGDGGFKKLTEDYIAPVMKDMVDNKDFELIGRNSRNAQELLAT